MLSFHNFGTASYQTAKTHLFHNGTSQWMNSCCHVKHVANSSSIWPISLTNFFLKFWLAVDVENKYLFNGFPYVGKDDTRSSDMSVLTDVVLKLMAPLFQWGYNFACDNYFTSLGLALKQVEKKCSLVGTLCQNGREVPEKCNKKKKLHESKVFRHDGQTTITYISYQCKAAKKRGSYEQLAFEYPCFKQQKSKKRNLIQYCTKIKQKWVWTFMTK